jgi:5-methyltetrahydrofolate--homocysteine methyltransferase
MTAFLDVLRSGRVLLMDGAMGTELQKVGLKLGENAVMWNLLHPKKVEAVHRAYLAAGAEVLLSNTFLINQLKVPPDVTWDDRCPQSVLRWPKWPKDAERGINRGLLWVAALGRMKDAATYRLAAVGPVAGATADREFDDLEYFGVAGNADSSEPKAWYHPHGILLETCSTPRVRFALERLRRSTKSPLLLSLAFSRDARGRLVTASGHSPEWFARRARGYGADALGANCGKDVGMKEMIQIAHRYREETDLPLFARPNGGTPKRQGRRWVYPLSPQEMADHLPELLDAGVCMVGGCCGTTPEHIAAFRKVVDGWNAGRRTQLQSRWR